MIAAVIPAAGKSARMGEPKLILTISGVPMITKVVSSFVLGGADRTIVVVAPPSAVGSNEVAKLASEAGAEVVFAATQPEDMRASVELAIEHLSIPPCPDALLVSPGDAPGTSSTVVARVLHLGIQLHNRIVLPRHKRRRAHPLYLPWELALMIRELPAGVGVNALLEMHSDRISHLEVNEPDLLLDIDTPQDYQRWRS